MNKICLFFFMCFIAAGIAQDDKKKNSEKDLKSSLDLTWEANQELSENEFVKAEADYRRAISKSDENVIAPYNLGTAYYKKESLEEAFGRFKQAGELAEAKPEKHKAFHNMGNVFMKNEEYAKAVEAYKEALRNNPEDEETRYNLALAKALAEQQKNQDKDEDAKEDEDSENKGKKEQEDQQQDNKEKDGGEQEEDENKDGDGNEKKDQPKEGEKPDEQKQPRNSQLSPQQIKNLLEAMQNEENKVQEKMNEKKVKGPKSKNAKDW